VEEAARVDQAVRRSFDVQDAGSGRHPLGGAVLDNATATDGVLVQEGALDHVGHGLEATVGVPRGALRFARSVVDLTHLIHVDKGVEIGRVDAGEGPTYRKPLALNAARSGRDGADATGSVDRGRRHKARQLEGVFNGDGGHGPTLPTPRGRGTGSGRR
jgi:hypothetical protein